MLKLLHIENIAVIEQADIEFEHGLIVMSGETGAGKSIIIDAIGAILGYRMSKDLLRQGAVKGSVHAVFCELSDALKEMLVALDLGEREEDELQIVRQITAEGKSTCRINAKPATAAVLKSLAPYLIDIYGQNDGQKLLDEKNHITFLDTFARAQSVLEEYTPLYEQLRTLKRQIRALDGDEAERLRRIDLLSFQKAEIEGAALQAGEEEALLQSKQMFDGQTQLLETLNEALLLFAGDETVEGIASKSEYIAGKLALLDAYSPEAGALGGKTQELAFFAEEIRAELLRLLESMEFSPEQREITEARLDELYHLKLKYGKSIEEIITYEAEITQELHDLQNHDVRREQLRETYRSRLAEAKAVAQKLTTLRLDAAGELERRVVSQLQALDMARVQFKVQLTSEKKLTSLGTDTVSFLISVNPGEALKPLSKVASGGELSRVMLAMKNVMTEDEDVGMLVFDEIDTGVSGSAAQKIAQKLSDIGAKKQTLCVTHLPQIAAMGDYHLHISKAITNERSYTRVEPLVGRARAEEIARMISGQVVTETSRKNAQELIAFAVQYKKEMKQ